MSQPVITAAVEGPTDLAVVKRLLRESGLGLGRVHVTGGKGKLDHKLRGYNNAARFSPWLVLRDLDRDAECAPELLNSLLPSIAPRMCLRIPVRTVEAWLLADRDAIARFLGVQVTLVPVDVENLPNPKRVLVSLARKSRRRALREDMVPIPGTSAQVGPGYSSQVNQYASDHWRPEMAVKFSDSLRRCLDALRALRCY